MLTAEELFQQQFSRAYPPELLQDLEKARNLDANPANNPAIVSELSDIAARFARLGESALGKSQGELGLDYSDASIHRLSRALTREVRDRLMNQKGPDGVPLLVTFVTHGALYVGECIVRNHGGVWLTRRPLWESQVELTSSLGTARLAPFSWWLKSLSDAEVDESRLADRYRTHVEVPCLDVGSLEPWLPSDRKIPRLSRVRYDTLYKHLRAHVPELRSVGDDFPSPERLDELSFKWLDFKVLGSGRMLLMHGPTKEGTFLFWFDEAGFLKQIFFPSDSFPEHRVASDEKKLQVMLSIGGSMQVHEMPWWGV